VFIMVVGVLLVFFGHRLYRPLLTSVGSFIFFLIAWPVLSASTSYSMWITILLSIPFALAGAMVFVACFWIAMWLFGAFIGFILAASLLAFGASGSALFNYLWCFSFAYAGGITSLLWKDVVLIIVSSFLGSYWIALGFDRLICRSGFSDMVASVLYYLVRMEYHAEVFAGTVHNNYYWALLSGFFVLSFVGMLVQWRFTAVFSKVQAKPVVVKED